MPRVKQKTRDIIGDFPLVPRPLPFKFQQTCGRDGPSITGTSDGVTFPNNRRFDARNSKLAIANDFPPFRELHFHDLSRFTVNSLFLRRY